MDRSVAVAACVVPAAYHFRGCRKVRLCRSATSRGKDWTVVAAAVEDLSGSSCGGLGRACCQSGVLASLSLEEAWTGGLGEKRY